MKAARSLPGPLVIGLVAAALSAGFSIHSAHDHHPDNLSLWHAHPGRALLAAPTDLTPARKEQDGKAGAGGRAVAYRPSGAPVGSAAAQTPEALLFHTGVNAAEPTLGLNKKGTIFYIGLQGNNWPLFPTETVRSRDEGVTWEIVTPTAGPRNRHFYSEDPYLYVDPETGRVFTNDFLLPCSELSFSDDEGETWTTVIMGCDVADHQTIFAGPPVTSDLGEGYPNIVYYCAIDGGVATVSTASSCLKSLDGGMTFVRTGLPAFTDDPGREGGNDGVPGHCIGANAHGVVDDKGTVYLPRGWCGQPWLAISKDEGMTWRRVQVADNGMNVTTDGYYDHEAGVAVDKKGNIYYTWIAENRMPYLAVSRDGGKKFSKPIPVAPPGLKESALPGIDVGKPGSVALIYMGSTNAPGPPFTDPYADVTWNGYMTMTIDALEDDPVFYTGTVNDPKEPLIEGACGPGRCQAEFDFLDIVIGPEGTPWASFVDGCFEDSCNHTGRFLTIGEGIVGRLVGGPPLR